MAGLAGQTGLVVKKLPSLIRTSLPSQSFQCARRWKGHWQNLVKKFIFFFTKSQVRSASSEFSWAPYVIRDLNIAVFWHFPRTSRSHVITALPWDLRFEVHVCTARPRSRGKWFTATFFCNLKHHNPTFELFCLLIIEFDFKKRNCEDNFSAKIEVSGWMKRSMAAASHHPLISSPKYGQTGNVKPLTANHSLPFAVKWPNLDLKVSIVFNYINRFMYINVFCDRFKLFRADRTKTGHALGPPDSRPTTPEPQRNLSPIMCSLLRIIMHSAMVMGACRNPQVTTLEVLVYWIWSSG